MSSFLSCFFHPQLVHLGLGANGESSHLLRLCAALLFFTKPTLTMLFKVATCLPSLHWQPPLLIPCISSIFFIALITFPHTLCLNMLLLIVYPPLPLARTHPNITAWESMGGGGKKPCVFVEEKQQLVSQAHSRWGGWNGRRGWSACKTFWTWS